MSDKSMIDLDLAHSLRTLSSTISPVAFAHQLGFTKLDDWQKSFLMATDRYVCVDVCRQAGKTSMAAAICTHAALTRPDSLILIVSPSQRQSHEMLLKIQRFYSTLGKPVPPEQENFYTLTLRNGARIISLPGQNPNQLRGFSAPDIICIDEAARASDEIYYGAVRPMLAVNPQSRLIHLSTPAGQRGFFYKTVTEEAGWSKYTVTADQGPGYRPNFLPKRNEKWAVVISVKITAANFLPGTMRSSTHCYKGGIS
jgi:Terminase large subunit, T4likevirus-type, N-terminal